MFASNMFKTISVFAIGFFAGAYFMHTKMRKEYEDIYADRMADLEDQYQEKEKNLDDKIEAKSLEKGVELAKSMAEAAPYSAATRTHEIIRPEELGETGYDVSYMTYHADGILTYDSDGSVAEEPERVVGPNALKNFGIYEKDIVQVRNHLYRKDYEIVRAYSTYADPDDSEEEDDG